MKRNVWKHFKKVNKSGSMNWNVQPLLPKWKLPRWEPNRKPLVQQALNAFAMLWRRCLLSDRLSILF